MSIKFQKEVVVLLFFMSTVNSYGHVGEASYNLTTLFLSKIGPLSC